MMEPVDRRVPAASVKNYTWRCRAIRDVSSRNDRRAAIPLRWRAEPSAAPLHPLNRVRAGCVVIIRKLTASPDTNQRLREMGFGEEQRVKVITLHNNVLCQVCNARLGLSAKLAESILVETVPPYRLAA